jgi:Fe2+ transport system protein FeoA
MTPTQLITCPLCGYGFDPATHLACQTCPLHSGCRLVCCPSCGHTTVDQGQSRIVKWISALFDRGVEAPQDRRDTIQSSTFGTASAHALADVPLNHQARVADVSALPAAQRAQLHGYGLLPGCVLRVIQRTPVTVVQIEHTDLAIEAQLARAIQVDEIA